MISGSFQSWFSGQSGTLLFKALCKIRRSRSSCIRFPVPYFSKFCAFNRGCITAKNDVLARSRALAKRLMFYSFSAAWLSSDLISRWSSLTFILCSGCLSFLFFFYTNQYLNKGDCGMLSSYGQLHDNYCTRVLEDLRVLRTRSLAN